MKSVQIVYNGAMAKRVQVQTELTAEELHERYRQTQDAVERTHWHILWQIKEGKSPRQVAELIGYTARWVRTIVQRWNAQGEAGIRDHRREIDVSRPLLSREQQSELAEVLKNPPADGGLWSGPSRRPVDARAIGASGGPATRVGCPATSRLQHAGSSSPACQSRSRQARRV